MIPAGYLLKCIVPPPAWLDTKLNHIEDVCSVSECVNKNVIDLQQSWLYNSFGMANDPETLNSLVVQGGLNLVESTLFYYTAYELELPSDGWVFDRSQWRPRTPLQSSITADNVKPPPYEDTISLIGYDVVAIVYGLDHSPLSCNSVAERFPVNKHCLLDSFEEAFAAISNGVFEGGCEEGMYTIFSVNLVG